MLRRLRRAAALVLVAQLAVVGVRVANASCAGLCDMGQGLAEQPLDDAGAGAGTPTAIGTHAMPMAMAMPMPEHDAVPTDGASHDAPQHDSAPSAPASCLAGASCAPPLAIVALAVDGRPTLVTSAPTMLVMAMLTRAPAAPEAPPPKA